MRVKVFSLEGQSVSEIDLPPVFETEFRPDVIRRAVVSAQSARFQPQGSNREAGKRTSAETWGKGHGASRVPRVKGSRYHAAGRAAISPHAVGGRRAHPPKAEKKIRERINRKERRLAIRSAIAATKDKKRVSSRGHVVDGVPGFPLVVTDEITRVTKTRELKGILQKLGAWKDVERVVKSKRIKAGRGKMRGRKYRKAVGPLLVVDKDEGIFKGAQNIPGLDVATVTKLGVETLAPGGLSARFSLWSQGAIKKLMEGTFA